MRCWQRACCCTFRVVVVHILRIHMCRDAAAPVHSSLWDLPPWFWMDGVLLSVFGCAILDGCQKAGKAVSRQTSGKTNRTRCSPFCRYYRHTKYEFQADRLVVNVVYYFHEPHTVRCKVNYVGLPRADVVMGGRGVLVTFACTYLLDPSVCT